MMATWHGNAVVASIGKAYFWCYKGQRFGTPAMQMTKNACAASSSSSKWEMFPLTNYMTKTFFRAKRWWWWLYHYIVHSTRKCKNCICWKVVFLENSMVISLCANQTWNSLSALELVYCKLIISRAAVQEFKLFILSFKSRRRSL